MIIGVIGIGMVGRAYADAFQQDGHDVRRHDKFKPEFNDSLAGTELVFVCVPTPTTPAGHDSSAVREALALVPDGAVGVVKSTCLPTEVASFRVPGKRVVYSPEFLREAHAIEDLRVQDRVIVGLLDEDRAAADTAAAAMAGLCRRVTPIFVMSAAEAAMAKYASNGFLLTKTSYCNAIYDLCQSLGLDGEAVIAGMAADSRIGIAGTKVILDGGRGAGGRCFIKDFAALSQMAVALDGSDDCLKAMISGLEQYNLDLLRKSGKSQDLVKSVYGE